MRIIVGVKSWIVSWTLGFAILFFVANFLGKIAASPDVCKESTIVVNQHDGRFTCPGGAHLSWQAINNMDIAVTCHCPESGPKK